MVYLECDTRNSNLVFIKDRFKRYQRERKRKGERERKRERERNLPFGITLHWT